MYEFESWIEINGVEFECKIWFNYEPEIKGKINCLPEDAEESRDAEIVVCRLIIYSSEPNALLQDMFREIDLTHLLFNEEFCDTVEALCWEEMEDDQ